MAEQLSRLKKVRGAVRTSITKLLHKIDELLERNQPPLDELEEYIDQLTLKERTIKDHDRDIEATSEEKDLMEEVTVAMDYMDQIIRRKSRVSRLMRMKDEKEDGNEQRSRHSGRSGEHVRLPKLIIETFSGDISKWQDFWNQFKVSIHENSSLSAADKFNYLKSLLSGTAANVVAGLSLSEENYDNATKMLLNRFGRKDLVINAHMNKLLNLNPVRRATDIVALRKLYDECEIQVRSLDAIGVVSDSYGSLLCPILMKMIPEEITLEFTRLMDEGSVLKVKELMTFLQKEVDSRERTANLTQRKETSLPPRDNAWERRGRRPPSAGAASTAAFYAANEDETPCIFCNKREHKSKNCVEFTVETRREKLRRQGRCYVCLGARHLARNCRAQGISCEECSGRHHKTVCSQMKQRTPHNRETPADAVVAIVPNRSENGTVLLQTATVWIDTPKHSKITRCLLDGGSQRSFIREDISKALNLPVVGEEILNLHTFGSVSPKRIASRRVKVCLRNIRNNQAVELELLETPQVCTSSNLKVVNETLRRTLQDKGLQIADIPVMGMETENLGILIGGDHYWKIVTGRMERLDDALVALESKFGWLVQGTVSMLSVTEPLDVGVLHVSMGEEQALSDQLRSFWETESLGIHMAKEQCTESAEALQKFQDTVKCIKGRYEVQLPWKEDQVVIADNYGTAEKRFTHLVRKFRNNPILYHRYNDVIQEYLAEGIVEQVQSKHSENPIYYLPHHAILREQRATTKLRVVFDASSHERDSRSLNECLLTGPNLNPDLLGILIRFRQYRVALMADITKAFLQISLNEKDRDALRFLWTTGDPVSMDQVNIMRMTRVPFGVSSSPFLLAATIRHHLKKYENKYPEVTKMLDECLYVDDFISGAQTIEAALELTQTAKEIMSAAGMDLCKWKTNSRELQKEWTQQIKGEQVEIKSQTPLKVLGLTWRTETDDFVFEIKELMEYLKDKRNTKRGVLQSAARIFDPIGFLSPFSIRVKCLFQEMWERGLDWDAELPNDLSTKWQQWCAELPNLPSITINRSYTSELEFKADSPSETEVHVFCDASESAYCAVAYMRTADAEGRCATSLIAAKTKVAPLKRITLPRLELMGALIGARLGKFINEHLKMTEVKTYYWTDSMIALHWIKSTAKQWKPFVHNRVIEIQSLTLPENWKHCRGAENPADRGTRGSSVQTLKEDSLWWHRPTWLRDSKTEGSSKEPLQREMEGENLECIVQTQIIKKESPNPLFDMKRFSKLTKVLRVTAWILRFTHNARKQDKRTGELCTEEIQSAERYWIQLSQKESFQKEVEDLLSGKELDRNSKLLSLKPFLDEAGLLRLGGRLQKANWSYAHKHPYILNGNVFSQLILKRAHNEVLHSGLQDTLTQVRETFWIIRGRQLTKKTIRQCLTCRRNRVRAGQQCTASLPRDRITEAQPFEVTGVDFAGPLYVKPHSKKAYVALFTCAVTRAVHLEIVSDLSADTFLLAFRRFIARRGICTTIYSDNAKTFKRADKDLKSMWTCMKEKQIQEFFAEKRITWKYIVEKAAWWGGMWERMVRSVKVCLRKVLGKAFLSFEELQTLLTEVEAVINSRPLTYVHTDCGEPSPLTPAHFLVGQRITTLPPQPTPLGNPGNADAAKLSKRWQYRQRLINRYWIRWKKEYLMELRSAHNVASTTKPTTFKVGDLVLLYEDKQPKHMWKMGRIEQVFIGRDGKIRSCSIKLSKNLVLKRPVQLLYPLELTDEL